MPKRSRPQDLLHPSALMPKKCAKISKDHNSPSDPPSPLNKATTIAIDLTYIDDSSESDSETMEIDLTDEDTWIERTDDICYEELLEKYKLAVDYIDALADRLERLLPKLSTK